MTADCTSTRSPRRAGHLQALLVTARGCHRHNTKAHSHPAALFVGPKLTLRADAVALEIMLKVVFRPCEVRFQMSG
jgi:hypothetical protein